MTYKNSHTIEADHSFQIRLYLLHVKNHEKCSYYSASFLLLKALEEHTYQAHLIWERRRVCRDRACDLPPPSHLHREQFPLNKSPSPAMPNLFTIATMTWATMIPWWGVSVILTVIVQCIRLSMSLEKLEKSMTHFKWFFFENNMCANIYGTNRQTLCENKNRTRGSDVKILLIKISKWAS